MEEVWGARPSSAPDAEGPVPVPAGLTAAGGCWVLGLAPLPVPGMQWGWAASRPGGLGDEGGDIPGEGVLESTACSCDVPGDSLDPSLTCPHV